MRMKNSKFYPALVLGTICLVAALLLAGVNLITAPIIEKNQNELANAALREVLPEGKNFQPIEITSDYPAIVTAGYKADGGFVFKMEVTGKSTGLIIMCGVDTNGHVVGTKVIASEETPSYAANVFPFVEGVNGKYSGMDLDGFDPFLVAQATYTSQAYADAVKAALQSAIIAAGGSVDTRTPEQILQDNCNAALGTTKLTYGRWFATEALVGIDKTYVPENGNNKQFVFVIGDKFIGVNATGVITAGISAEDAAKATAAYALASTSNPTPISELPKGVDTRLVKKAYVTAHGSYVFELSGNGYYSKPIEFSLSVTADGKIIDMVTTSQHEHEGQGGAGNEAYYDKWIGATADDIVISTSSKNPDIGAIAGSTFTSKGYQEAVKAALQAATLLSGGKVDPAQLLESKIAELAPGFVNPKAVALPAGSEFAKIFKASNDAGFAYIYSDGEIGYLVLVNATGVCAVYNIDGEDVTDAQATLAESAKAHAKANQKSYDSNLTMKVEKLYATASDITTVEVNAFGTLVSALTFKVDGADYYAFYSRSMGYKQMDVYIIIDANGAIAKLDVKSLLFDEEYFQYESSYPEDLDPKDYKEGFEGITSDWTGEEAMIAGATKTSNAIKQSTNDAFDAFELITAKGGDQQ